MSTNFGKWEDERNTAGKWVTETDGEEEERME